MRLIGRWPTRSAPFGRPRSLPAPGDSASRRKPSSQDARRSSQLSLRNIVLRVGRPVLAVVGDVPQLEFTDSESEVWRSRLQASTDLLQRAARAVGRIDVIGLPRFEYVGTGWLVEREHDRDQSSRGPGIRPADPRPLHVQERERRHADHGVHRLPRRNRPPRATRVSDRRDPPHRGRGRSGLRAPARGGDVGRTRARSPDSAGGRARPAGAADRRDRVSRPGQPGSGRPVDAVDLR